MFLANMVFVHLKTAGLILPNVSSSTDEDEDGDRITVRSDEEMEAMLSYVSILQMRTVF